MDVLNNFYSDEGFERVGFIIGNEIIEVTNICRSPDEGFMVSTSDILEYGDKADATWHTHPNAPANLSQEDYVSIKNWPNMRHYIIGKDGVRCYKYDKDLKAIIEVTDG